MSIPAPPPSLRFPIGEKVVPGDRLGNIRQVQAGAGTHVQGDHIYATLIGTLQVGPATSNDNEDDGQQASKQVPKHSPPFSCWVNAATASSSKTSSPVILASSRVLKVGQLIFGRVSRITPQNALVEIALVEGVGSLGAVMLEGAIRMEDIRGGASEQVVIGDCFQPGDLVACRVVSMGDSRRYFLSTAETQLGVVRAICKTSGQIMIPTSWKEMQCPETGVKELRKCAKPGTTTTSSGEGMVTPVQPQQEGETRV